jgi:hypothetical protein
MKEELEVWKDIPEYEGLYQISNLGRVKSLSRYINRPIGGYYTKERILKNRKNSCGYYLMQLFKDGNMKNILIHQLVAIAFLNHKPNGHELVIDHINDNKLDNRVENLQIVTQRFNTRKTQGNSSSRYKGVSWCKTINRWKVVIFINGKSKYLGVFKCELAASYAYQKALKELL